MNMSYKTVLFTIDNNTAALPVENVERVLRAVAVTPFPNAPDVIIGMVVVEGEPVPVASFYKRIGKEQPPVTPDTHFILVKGNRFRFILPVDSVLGYAEVEEKTIIPKDALWTDIAHTRGVFLLDNKTLFLADADEFLTASELQALENLPAPEINS